MIPIVAALLISQVMNCGLQEGEGGELRFHRVHLKNGNFIDGDLVKDGPNEVVLRLKVGEMNIRRDQIDKIELVKMKSSNNPPIIRPDPRKGDPAKTDLPPAPKIPDTTPEQIKKKVDVILFKFKNAPGGGEGREIPYEEIGALGEEAVVYLANRAPAFDLKTQDAIGVALLNLKPTPKVVSVLESHLSSESAVVRAFAINVLCVSGGDGAKIRYLRPMLKDPDARVRTIALSMLGSSTDRDWIEPLLDCSSDKDKDVRTRALRIAQNLCEKHGAMDRFERVLLANLSNPDLGVRVDAINLIGLLGQKENWTPLARLLTDADAPIRAAAAHALATMGASEAAEDVLTAVGREQDSSARIGLAAVIQKLRLQKAIDPILGWLSSSDQDVKRVTEATLKVLTGENFGQDPEKWAAWWEKNKPK